MSYRTLATWGILALRIVSGLASPVVASADEELVLIPGGLVPKSNVHRIPDGGKVVHTPTAVHLVGADGTILHTSPLTSSTPRFNLPNVPGMSSGIGPRNLQSTIIAAVAQLPTVLGFMSSWILPPLPQVNSGQTLMYFSALTPPNGDSLIQPTLQYGVSAAGGGPFWSIASWFIVGSQAFVTNLTELSPGSLTLPSFIVNEDEFLGTPTTHAWFCGFEGFTPQTGLNIQTAEVFNVAFEALEIFNAVSFSNLPNEPTDIEEISIETAENVFLNNIPWIFTNDTADGITMNNATILSDDDSLFIKYPGEL